MTAKGTRTTIEIAAGAIGNELPITVTAEEWVAVDLKVLVMTKHDDPRTGETTYRLTGIIRGEPDPIALRAAGRRQREVTPPSRVMNPLPVS